MFDTLIDIAWTIAPYALAVNLTILLFAVTQAYHRARWERKVDRCFRVAYQAGVEPYVVMNAFGIKPYTSIFNS